jgi:hypothetical protein
MIQVKEAVLAARDIPRAHTAAYRTAAVAELSALIGEGRSCARACFDMHNFFRFMKSGRFWKVRQ